MPFSTQLTQWLSQYRTFVNTGDLLSSDQAGRSLGPASGVIGDLYPFLNLNAFTGLFAGLSLSGFDANAEKIQLTKYRSRTGFRPVSSGPFSGTGWQGMTGEDWCRLDPTKYPALTDPELAVNPVHALDLELTVSNMLIDTQKCDYSSRHLSGEYQLHYWWQENAFAITAVTFRTAHETLAPFLRPNYVADAKAILDPVCLFPASRTARLFGGLAVLSAGEHTEVTIAEPVTTTAENPLDIQVVPAKGTTVILSRNRLAREQAVRSLSGARPNAVGGIMLQSTGLHRISQPYEAIDTERGLVQMTPHVLCIQSHDQPCCSCEDYAEAWNKISRLYAEQAVLIEEYNELFTLIKQLRDEMEALFCDMTRPVRARRDAVSVVWQEDEDFVPHPRWRAEFTIFILNAKENTLTHPPSVFRLVSGKSEPRLLDAFVRQSPRDMNFRVTDVRDSEFQIDKITVPSHSRKAVHVYVDIEYYRPSENFAVDVSDLKLVWCFVTGEGV